MSTYGTLDGPRYPREGDFCGGTGGLAVEYAITAATRPFANFIWSLIPLAYFLQMEFVFNP